MRLPVLSLSLLCLTTLACAYDGNATSDPETSGSDTPATGSAGSAGSADSTDSTDGATDPDPTSTTSPTDPTADPTDASPNCGDGKVDADEDCDAGAANSNQSDCTSICTKANCGDGWVHTGVEECDDANVDYSDACTVGCKLQVCGDHQLGKGEGCDDGNDIDDDGCSNECAPTTCGNGSLDIGETCDDGNEVDTDACLNTCQSAVCGDLIVWAGTEECDDGNTDDTDGCTSQCTQGGRGPTCDDNMKNGDESDLDCGGSCTPCADGEACNGGGDCIGGNCNGGVCEPGNQVTLDPANCAPAMVGVDAAFAGAIMGNCGCHGGGSGGLQFSDAASFKAVTVNVDATNADMKRITPGNIDASYILYKLHGQQDKVPGGGGKQMPLGGSQLSDDKLCLMINWVKSIK